MAHDWVKTLTEAARWPAPWPAMAAKAATASASSWSRNNWSSRSGCQSQDHRVLISSFPYAIDFSQEHMPGDSAHGAQLAGLGTALAEVLFGDYNPGGTAGHLAQVN